MGRDEALGRFSLAVGVWECACHGHRHQPVMPDCVVQMANGREWTRHQMFGLASTWHDKSRRQTHTHTPADSRRHTKFQSAVRSMDNWLQWNAMSTDCVWALCVCVCAFWRASGADHTTIHKYNRVLSNYMRIVKDDCRPEYAMHSMQAMNTRACSHTLMDHLGNLCLNNF